VVFSSSLMRTSFNKDLEDVHIDLFSKIMSKCCNAAMCTFGLKNLCNRSSSVGRSVCRPVYDEATPLIFTVFP